MSCVCGKPSNHCDPCAGASEVTFTLGQIEQALRVVLSTKTHRELVNLAVEETRTQLQNAQRHAAEAGGRNSGRTLRMVRELPSGTRYIVVHDTQMKMYVERMLHDVRPDLTAEGHNRPFVIVVKSTRDCDRLRGCRFAVDHAMFEHANPEVCTLLHALAIPRAYWKRGPVRHR